MTLIARTATIQARVFPGVKEASERVLRRIGLNMSEAMELFLRRVIADERIPFEIVALDAQQLASVSSGEASQMTADGRNRTALHRRQDRKGSVEKKSSKLFPGSHTSTKSTKK